MGDNYFDPDLPRTNSVISSEELRNQFIGLSEELHNELNTSVSGCAVNPWEITPLNLTVSNPPTQQQVQAIANKVDALIAALKRT